MTLLRYQKFSTNYVEVLYTCDPIYVDMTIQFTQYLTLLQYIVAALVLLSELATRCGFPFNSIEGKLDFHYKNNKHSPKQKHQMHTIITGFIKKRTKDTLR